MREHYYEMSKEDLLNEEIQILTNDGLKEKIKKIEITCVFKWAYLQQFYMQY